MVFPRQMQKVDAGALNWEEIINQISVYGNKEAVMKIEQKTIINLQILLCLECHKN
jgi:hypothetical protein